MRMQIRVVLISSRINAFVMSRILHRGRIHRDLLSSMSSMKKGDYTSSLTGLFLLRASCSWNLFSPISLWSE